MNIYKPTPFRMALVMIILLQMHSNPANALNQDLNYELHWSGIKVGEMGLYLKEDGNKYDYTINIASRGMLKYFIKYFSSNRSQGLIEGAKLVPEIYKSYWKRKKHSQNLEINFANNDVKNVLRVPENRKKHPEVPKNMLKNAFDPVSGAFEGRQRIKQAVEAKQAFPYKITIPIYDAKRLFDAEIYVQGYKLKNIGGKKQNLLHIILKRTPIAGFRPNKLKEMQEGEGDPDIEMYLNQDFIPIWGFGKAELGTATITLK